MNTVKSLKVLHVVGAMNRAGTETMLMNIYRNININEMQFDFISYSNKQADYDSEIMDLGGKVIALTKTNSIKQLYQAMKQHGPYDVVHAHTLLHCGIVMVAASLANVKVRISHAHTTSDNNFNVMRKIYMYLMKLLIIIFSTNLLACSKEAGRYLFGEKLLNSERYIYFPNVIDYSLFMNIPKSAIAKFKVEEGIGKNIVIGHIGTFTKAKNHLFLIEIMENLLRKTPNIKLLLVGDGEERKRIEEEVTHANLLPNIKFLGKRTDIATILNSIDVFVFPSVYEGLGLVLLEAQACGVPCVVSEAIQPEANINAGLMSQISLAEGPPAWANQIVKHLGKRERNQNKIINGFERNGYSLTKGITTLLNVYHSKAGENYEQHTNRFL